MFPFLVLILLYVSSCPPLSDLITSIYLVYFYDNKVQGSFVSDLSLLASNDSCVKQADQVD